MSLLRIISSFLMSILLVLNTWPVMAAVAAQSARQDHDHQTELLQSLTRLTGSLQQLQSLFDRSQFDLDELLSSLDYDHENIIRFVREEIGLEVYSGTLRGAQGTLMSRAGNSLDQSILLAKLLKDAGFDARIAQTKVGEKEARAIVSEMRRPRNPVPPMIPPDKLDQAKPILQELKKIGLEYDLALGEFTTEALGISAAPVYNDIFKTADVLKSNLKAANIALDDGSSDILIEEAADYFWVQFKAEPGPWENAHPVFRDAAPFVPEFSTVFAEQIPAELQHTFAVQVFIESTLGRTLQVKPVSSKWERPTANLNAIPLVFSNVPNTMMDSEELFPNLQTALADASWFAPVFHGGLAPESEFFDKNGTIIDPMAAGDPAAGVFQTIGDLFGRAVGEMGDSGRPTLTAQWMEFTFTSPDGSVRKHRRTILDRIGAAARQSGELDVLPDSIGPDHLSELLQRHTFMLSMGDTPRALAVDFVVQSLMEAQAFIEQLLTVDVAEERATRALGQEAKNAPQHWNGHLALFTLLDLAKGLSDHHLIYRSAPSLVVHTEGLSGRNSFVRAIDIVQNPRRAVDLHAEFLALDPSALISAGVWETSHEGLLLGPSANRFNTLIAFDRAAEAKANLKTFSSPALVSELAIDRNAKAAIKTDLESGFAVIAPDLDQAEGSGWWRIDPRTGETLGQINDGRGGSDVVEYLGGLALGMSIGLLAVGLVGCTKAYDPPTLADVQSDRARLACCFLANAVLFGIGLLLPLGAAVVWDTGWQFAPTMCAD